MSESVNEAYSNIAKQIITGKQTSCCDDSCCGDDQQVMELKDLPRSIPSLGSDKDLIGFAKPQKGETVVDLGSGPGRDVLNFAREVGSTGYVIGIDFSDDMIELAKKHASEAEITNVEFRKGSIEHMPVDSESIDLIISNCVINLADNKENVFISSYKILKDGGRIVFSDLVVKDIISEKLTNDIDAVCGCFAGTTKQSYIHMLKKAGFKDVKAYNEYEFTKEFNGSDIEYTSTIFQAIK
ncbi:MAG: methyltransferase domain-containing protein [Candidatus Heimdallarchaeota archaeon]